MNIPFENYLAAFPPTEIVEHIALGPLTISGAIRLSALGVDVGLTLDAEKAVIAAAVLAGYDPACFAKRFKGDLNALASAVNRQLNVAFTTFVKGQPSPRSGGNGWPLELAEFLLGEYGWPWKTCLDTPLVTAFALLVCARTRNGGENGAPDYIERIKIKQLLAAPSSGSTGSAAPATSGASHG